MVSRREREREGGGERGEGRGERGERGREGRDKAQFENNCGTKERGIHNPSPLSQPVIIATSLISTSAFDFFHLLLQPPWYTMLPKIWLLHTWYIETTATLLLFKTVVALQFCTRKDRAFASRQWSLNLHYQVISPKAERHKRLINLSSMIKGLKEMGKEL